VLAYSLWVQYIVGSVPARVKSKTIKLVYISSLLSKAQNIKGKDQILVETIPLWTVVDGRASDFDL
jgi:hypothetical protein